MIDSGLLIAHLMVLDPTAWIVRMLRVAGGVFKHGDGGTAVTGQLDVVEARRSFICATLRPVSTALELATARVPLESCGALKVEFYVRPDGDPWRIPLQAAMAALEEAKQRLTE